MEVFNLNAEQDWEAENDRDGYRHRRTAIGPRLGASLLGGTLYEVPPGEKTWPYHYEHGCDDSGYPVQVRDQTLPSVLIAGEEERDEHQQLVVHAARRPRCRF